MLRRRFLPAALILLVLTPACRRHRTAAEDVRLANKVATRNVTLFYETPDLLLGPEQRALPLPENDSAAMPIVVSELLKGSKNAAVSRILPPDVVSRAVYFLPDGTAIVDLGGNSLTNGWTAGSQSELMAVYSIVTTLTTNFPRVRSVRILVNGQVAETLGGHIAIDHPLHPSRSFLVAAAPAVTATAR